MPYQRQILTNPNTGDRYEFIETAADTKGDRVVMKAHIRSCGKLVPNHMHVLQDERFEVLTGKLTIWSDGRICILSAGEQISLPKNKAHNHYNSGAEELCYIHTVRPTLDFDYFIENMIAMSADPTAARRKDSLLQKLVSLRYLDSKAYLTDIPLGIQKLLMIVLSPIGRLLGYRAIYKKYTGIEK